MRTITKLLSLLCLCCVMLGGAALAEGNEKPTTDTDLDPVIELNLKPAKTGAKHQGGVWQIPMAEGDISVSFRWNAIADAEKYVVVLPMKDENGNAVTHTQTATTISFSTETLLKDTSYAIRVSAVGRDGEVLLTETINFKLKEKI